MSGEILERIEARAELVYIATVEEIDRLAQGEVTDRPRARPREVAAEEPFGRPGPEPAHCDEARPDLVVGQQMKPFEVEIVAGEADHVLGLAPREAELDELRLVGSGNPRPGRERIGLAGPDAQAAR